MAPTPRRRYSRIPVGLLESLPPDLQKTKPSAPLLLLWLLLSPHRRSLPGVVRAGEVVIADAIGWTVAGVKGCREQLEKANLVQFDAASRVWFVPSAIDDDPPRNENVVKSWAADLLELPHCAIRDKVQGHVAAVLASRDEEAHLTTWRELTTGAGTGNSSPNSSGNCWGTPQPKPQPQPRPSPLQPPPPPAVAEAWARLPSPPFAAAAAQDLARVEEELGLPTYASLVRALSCSKYLHREKFNLKGPTPTLRRLLVRDDVNLVQRICDGEFRDESLQPSCARCGADHDLLDACPPRCDDCGQHHAEGHLCDDKRRRLEADRELERWQSRADVTLVEDVLAVNPAPANSAGELPANAPRLREMLPADLRASLERRQAGRAS